MRRRTGAAGLVVVAGLTVTGLAGCGDSDQAYCDAAQGVGQRLSGAATDKDANFASMARQFQRVADKAPPAIQGDWLRYVESLRKFDKLKDQMKDPAKVAAVAKKMQGVAADLSASAKSVQADLQRRCGD